MSREAKVKLFSGFVFLFVLQASCFGHAERHFVYIVDISGSMKDKIDADRQVLDGVREALFRDFNDLAKPSPLYTDGDIIHLWLFDVEVHKVIENLVFTDAERKNIHAVFSERLVFPQYPKNTDIVKPLNEISNLIAEDYQNRYEVFLYTDGQDNINKEDLATILMRFDRVFKSKALGSFFVVQYGEISDALDKVSQTGGVVEQTKFSEDTPADPESLLRKQANVTVEWSPSSLAFDNAMGAEQICSAPITLKIKPEGRSLNLNFNFIPDDSTLNWKLIEPLYTEGTDGQTVDLLLKGDNFPESGGEFKGLIEVTSSGIPIPGIPVILRVKPPDPEEIQVQFRRPTSEGYIFTAMNDWRPLSDFSLMLKYPSSLSNAPIEIQYSAPEGIEVQAYTSDVPEKSISLNTPVLLEDLSEVMNFRIRQSASPPIGIDGNITFLVALAPQEQERIVLTGKKSIDIPVRFVAPLEIECKTQLIDLGTLTPENAAVAREIEFALNGEPSNVRLRLEKNEGLESIMCQPLEFLLNTGEPQSDIVFSGFEAMPPGRFSGVLELSLAQEVPGITLLSPRIAVSGVIQERMQIVASIENSLIAGKPMLIHASVQNDSQAEFSCTISTPAGRKPIEFSLQDSGLAEHGDSVAGDGIYSAIFKDTTRLGGYEVSITADVPGNTVTPVKITEPVLFSLPLKPITKRWLSESKLSAPLLFNIPVISESIETVSMGSKLSEVKDALSETSVKIGIEPQVLNEGKQNVSVTLTFNKPTSGSMFFSVPVTLGPVQNRVAEVDLTFDLRVISSGTYKTLLLLCLVGIVAALLFIWVFLIVRIAQSARLRYSSRMEVSVFSDSGMNLVLLSAACLANRWKSPYKLFALAPRASFGGSAKADIKVSGLSGAISGYIYPRAKQTYEIVAVRTLQMDDDVELKAGMSRMLSTNEEHTIKFEDGNSISIAERNLF